MDIILATNNKNKVLELKRMLEPLGYTLYSQKEKGIQLEVEETGRPLRKTPASRHRYL